MTARGMGVGVESTGLSHVVGTLVINSYYMV